MNVVFVKFGTKYNADHVNLLAEKLKFIGPVYCYTDDTEGVSVPCISPIRRLNGVWNKLALFSLDFPVQGETLYLDIDVAVRDTTNLKIPEPSDSLYLIHNQSKQSILTPTNYDVTINSSIMLFDNTKKPIRDIWSHFSESGLADYFMRKYAGIDRYIFHEGFETKPHYLSTSWKYNKLHDRPFITYEESYDEYLREISQAD